MLVNREYERLFDVRREEIVGLTDHDLFPIEMADDFRANDLHAAAIGRPVQVEETAPGEDGMHTYVTVKFPLMDSAGKAYAVCGISTDITDRKRAEEQVRQLNSELERRVRERTAELEASTRELDAFAYSVSHDLRAPLRSLDGFSQALLEDYSDSVDEMGQHYLRRIQANATRMAQLIDDLLKLSHATRTELRREKVDLAELSREVFANLRDMEVDREVEISIGADLVGTGDPRLVRLVLDNLLANAWKFTGGREHALIEVGSMKQDDQRVFYVRDNGAGFDMRYAAKLFDPFQRLHAATDFEGSGIGLAIVHRIVLRHGGRIWANSSPGEGATFFFTFDSPPSSGTTIDQTAGLQSAIQTGLQAGLQPGLQAETESETRTETRTETQSETRTETQSETQAADGQQADIESALSSRTISTDPHSERIS
jgi:PAS domain S-box-containing protein